MRRLHLVRHGRSAVDRDVPAHEWGLDPAGYPAIEELRRSGRLPVDAVWYSSTETKALETARALTASTVSVVPALREHERNTTHWFAEPAEFCEVVHRAFAQPDEPAFPGWEPLSVTRDRVVPAVREILAGHRDDEIVLVGHGTAWTTLVASLSAAAPDLDAWAALAPHSAGRHTLWLL